MRPLDGLRVLDLGIITAGAATSQLLRDMGAEVIKIESARYADPFREWIGRDLGGEGSPFFRATNRGKLGLGLDLKTDAGRAVFLRLAARCDVVVENFRRGVLDRLGLSFETLAAVNPKIVLASISSQGEFGPDAMQVSYGSTLEGVSGLAWLSGYADGAPEVSGVDFNYPDQVVATFASGMIVAALRDREQAVHLDLSQRELTSFLIGSAFTARALGETPARSGNADPAYPIQDCFRTLDARWLAVSVDAAHMDPLAGLLGTAPSTESLAGFVAHLRHNGVAAGPPEKTATAPRAYLCVSMACRGSDACQSAGPFSKAAGSISSSTNSPMPMSATMTSPQSDRPGWSRCPGFLRKKVTVSAASKLVPSTSPVSPLTPDGRSTATTGMPLPFTRAMISATGPSTGLPSPAPKIASTTRLNPLGSNASSASAASGQSAAASAASLPARGAPVAKTRTDTPSSASSRATT